MAAALLIALFFTGTVLSLTEAQELPELYQKGVDLALEQLHSHKAMKHHFRFFKTLDKSDIDAGHSVNYIYHHFYFKATKCPKGTTETNPKKCAFRNDRPLVDCAVCYKTYAGEMETEPKPYVHCVHRPALTEEMKTERTKHCDAMSHTSGSSTLLASRTQ